MQKQKYTVPDAVLQDRNQEPAKIKGKIAKEEKGITFKEISQSRNLTNRSSDTIDMQSHIAQQDDAIVHDRVYLETESSEIHGEVGPDAEIGSGPNNGGPQITTSFDDEWDPEMARIVAECFGVSPNTETTISESPERTGHCMMQTDVTGTLVENIQSQNLASDDNNNKVQDDLKCASVLPKECPETSKLDTNVALHYPDSFNVYKVQESLKYPQITLKDLSETSKLGINMVSKCPDHDNVTKVQENKELPERIYVESSYKPLSNDTRCDPVLQQREHKGFSKTEIKASKYHSCVDNIDKQMEHDFKETPGNGNMNTSTTIPGSADNKRKLFSSTVKSVQKENNNSHLADNRGINAQKDKSQQNTNKSNHSDHRNICRNTTKRYRSHLQKIRKQRNLSYPCHKLENTKKRLVIGSDDENLTIPSDVGVKNWQNQGSSHSSKPSFVSPRFAESRYLQRHVNRFANYTREQANKAGYFQDNVQSKDEAHDSSYMHDNSVVNNRLVNNSAQSLIMTGNIYSQKSQSRTDFQSVSNSNKPCFRHYEYGSEKSLKPDDKNVSVNEKACNSFAGHILPSSGCSINEKVQIKNERTQNTEKSTTYSCRSNAITFNSVQLQNTRFDSNGTFSNRLQDFTGQYSAVARHATLPEVPNIGRVQSATTPHGQVSGVQNIGELHHTNIGGVQRATTPHGQVSGVQNIGELHHTVRSHFPTNSVVPNSEGFRNSVAPQGLPSLVFPNAGILMDRDERQLTPTGLVFIYLGF